MTFGDTLVHYQLRFEYGISKMGMYFAIINLGLLVIANLTLKGIFFPLWGMIAVVIGLVIFCTFLGEFLIRYGVGAALQSKANQSMNPEISGIVKTLERLEGKIDILEAQVRAIREKENL
jgi:hypothetical protein